MDNSNTTNVKVKRYKQIGRKHIAKHSNTTNVKVKLSRTT